jgi:hypothetical protein
MQAGTRHRPEERIEMVETRKEGKINRRKEKNERTTTTRPACAGYLSLNDNELAFLSNGTSINVLTSFPDKGFGPVGMTSAR